jgi:polyisoprenoid-binding protein YceI
MKKIFLISAIAVLSATACTQNTAINTPTEEINMPNNMDIVEEKIENNLIPYTIDLENSSLEWTGAKIIGSSHTGTIDIIDGTLILDEDREPRGGNFTIDMASLKDSEGSEMLEGHLKSADFFDVEKYPDAKLEIKNIAKTSDENYEISGLLRIKENTNEIKFPANIKIENNTVLAQAEFSIDRTLWNVRYGSDKFFKGLGDNIIKDEIDFKVSVQVNID